MAPSGPRNSDSRNTRSMRTAGGGRGGRGGGISKRRDARSAKVDRDGDLDMDAPVNGAGKANSAPTGPRRSQRSSNNNQSRPPKPTKGAQKLVSRILGNDGGSNLSSRIARAARPINAAHVMSLKVEGLQNSKAANNEGGGLKELLIFLERKATTMSNSSRSIRIQKSKKVGDLVYVTASKEDAEEILKINGFTFAGAVMTITQISNGQALDVINPIVSHKTQVLREQLTAILEQRYNPATKLLNLSNLRQDPGLNQMDFFTGENNPTKLFRAFMAICETKFPSAQAKRDAIVSVSLTDNSIDDVFQVMSLADTFPELLHLDLSRNQIRELKGLRKWQHRLQKMETLLLNENPIEASNPTYKDEVKMWFPNLQNLSGILVVTKPTPIPQHGSDFRDINRVGEAFITEFMRIYDVDRSSLAAKYYDEKSTFSLSVNTNSPHPPNMPHPRWEQYIKLSRNHKKINHPPARSQRLFEGTNSISAVFNNLPATQHPDILSQFERYIIDCHPLSGLVDPTGQSPAGVDGMIMTIHGEFEDQDPNTKNTTKRGFSRTFVLGPGAPGRNPIRIISDMLSLKAYTPLPSPVPTTAAAPVAVPVSTENTQQQMVLELCKQTGMTPDYSKLCLDGVGWNFDQALASFHEKRAQLPAEAFASVTL